MNPENSEQCFEIKLSLKTIAIESRIHISAIPALLQGCEIWTKVYKKKEDGRDEIHDIQAGYSLLDHKRSEDVLEKVKVEPVQKEWKLLCHVSRMADTTHQLSATRRIQQWDETSHLVAWLRFLHAAHFYLLVQPQIPFQSNILQSSSCSFWFRNTRRGPYRPVSALFFTVVMPPAAAHTQPSCTSHSSGQDFGHSLCTFRLSATQRLLLSSVITK